VIITTKRGDGGETSLVGGIRVSKGDLRVEAYGTIDELNTALGFARSICTSAEITRTGFGGLPSWKMRRQETIGWLGKVLGV
jgi:hypothetical protein